MASQDIYAEPKFIKKKRKKEINQGIKNPTWNQSTTPLPTKEIISTIVPHPISNLDRNFETKVQGRHLALDSTRHSKSKKLLDHSTNNKKRRTERQVQFLQLEDLIRIEQQRYKYENFIPLHKLWLGYMSELLEVQLKTDSEVVGNMTSGDITLAENFKGISSVANMQSKLLKADYHGAYMTVQKAKNPSLVGLQGIMIQESEQTFKLIDSGSKIKVIPKQHCILQISLPLLISNDSETSHPNNYLSFNIFGNQFTFRPTDRVNKKFKPKGFFEL